MSNCSKHKKEVAGVSDMKILAEMIGNLHYESLAGFLNELAAKLKIDAEKDYDGSRTRLADQLYYASNSIANAYYSIQEAWKISKPFMENEKVKSK
jgi:hypothetical protein